LHFVVCPIILSLERELRWEKGTRDKRRTDEK
jgi:hypothetical protein